MYLSLAFNWRGEAKVNTNTSNQVLKTQEETNPLPQTQMTQQTTQYSDMRDKLYYIYYGIFFCYMWTDTSTKVLWHLHVFKWLKQKILNPWNIVEVLVFFVKVQSRFIFLSSLVRRFKFKVWWIKLWKMSIIEANAHRN